jgi:hypothetical protein
MGFEHIAVYVGSRRPVVSFVERFARSGIPSQGKPGVRAVGLTRRDELAETLGEPVRFLRFPYSERRRQNPRAIFDGSGARAASRRTNDAPVVSEIVRATGSITSVIHLARARRDKEQQGLGAQRGDGSDAALHSDRVAGFFRRSEAR